MPVAYSDSHPTLYVVSLWWNRLGSVLYMKNWLGSSMNQIQGRMTVWICYCQALETGCLIPNESSYPIFNAPLIRDIMTYLFYIALRAFFSNLDKEEILTSSIRRAYGISRRYKKSRSEIGYPKELRDHYLDLHLNRSFERNLRFHCLVTDLYLKWGKAIEASFFLRKPLNSQSKANCNEEN